MTGIAKLVGIEVRDFIAANPQLADPDLLHPGEVLNLP
jgi:nucleoid-associated protein YgaU